MTNYQLYNISRSRDASVFEVMHCANGRISWDLQFRRLVNDQESHSLDSFLVLIYSTKVRGVGSDKFCWKPANSQGFKVSGYYQSLSPSSHFFPLENGMAIKGSSLGSILLLDSGFRQDSNYR